MDAAEAQAFLREHHHAVLTTFRSDGRPQLSPVACTVDEDGRVVVSTRETAMKTSNLRRDPRVALCVFTDKFFGPWVQVEGEAEIVELPEAMEPLVDYYRRVAGEHDDWDDYRAAMQRERRVVVRFAITRAGPNITG
ncbi:TIGR03618 family F420-dependent PPOX class oxidoreductase [soil metagenome]